MSDSSHDALMQELLQMFAVEADEHIETLNQTLLKLEKQPGDSEKAELLKAAFRAAHSLKGSARAVELMNIEGVAHDAESVLNAARNGDLAFTPDVVDVLLNATDMIQAMVKGEKRTPEQITEMRAKLKVIIEKKESPPPAAKTEAPKAAPPEAKSPAEKTPANNKPSNVSVASKPGSSSVDALMQELLQMFAVEAAEHIQTLNQSLLELEKQPSGEVRAELLKGAFRAAHSLKGSARAVELMDIEGVAHEAETVLNAARNNKLDFTPDVVDLLLTATDHIQTLVEGKTVDAAQLADIRQKLSAAADRLPSTSEPATAPPTPTAAPRVEPAPPPEQKAPPVKAEAPKPAAPIKLEPPPQPELPRSAAVTPGTQEETIRVSVEKLDDLMAQAGELIVSKISADERLRELRDLRSLLLRWDKVWTQTTDLQRRIDSHAREADDQPEWREVLEFLRISHRYFSESVQMVRALDKSMTADNMRMALVTDAIQDEIRRVRMLPMETLVPTMQRVVRDVARQVEKHAQLVVRGMDVELDKKVLESLKDPMVHLLRNSVDHGIETPEVRRQSGKPEIGTVTVSVTQRGGNVHIIVADDGRGIDAEAIKQSAINKGMIQPAEAENMSDEDAYLLIFQAGFSTKQEVTSVSGRGVGMDVVKAQLENLQGRINIRSTPGVGSEFHLILPISLATIRGLIVRVGRDRYALPLHAVEKIVSIVPSTIYTVEGNMLFDLNGEPMPVLYLADIIERPREASREDRMPAVIVAGGERRMAFVVDDFISEQEMVVKSLGRQLRRVRNVAGATLLGTGQPIIILNVVDLIKSAQGGRVLRQPIIIQPISDEDKEKPPTRILVVDDSITTRTLERNILTGAGYDVLTATDGVEALALLETEHIDVVVADIEMPRIDGFELVEWIRQSPRYGEVPVILVTSLESQEHRERGLRAGADAYIVKSGFEQKVLLQTIEQFV